MLRFLVDPARPEPGVIHEAARVLKEGGIVAFPTDTLYGLACDPRIVASLAALCRLKGRSPTLRFPFIASGGAQAEELVSLEGEIVLRLTDRFWPGPLSLVLPLVRVDRLAPWPWGETLAVRVPAAPAARALAREVGLPIPATSANLSGEAPVSDPAAIPPELAAGIDLLLDGGALPPSLPSTLLDATAMPPRLLRIGAISREVLETIPGMPSLTGAPSPRG